MFRVGRSLELPLPINSKTFMAPLGLSGGTIMIPSSPTTIMSPRLTSLMGTQVA